MSLFTVDRILVIRVSTSALEYSRKVRQEAIEKRIKDLTTPKKYLFGLITIKPPSREKAEEIARTEKDAWGFIPWWRTQYWDIIGKAKKLIDACSVSETNTVQLDTEDANFIEEWKNKTELKK